MLTALFFLAATIPPPQFADADRPRKLAAAFPEVEKLFTAFVEKQHIPGAAVGIIIDGELVWVQTTGFRDVAAKAPATRDTVWRIASMTKSFTSMAILKLRDEGKLSLDDPVSKYVPELANLTYPTADSPRLTIRHLLTHAEGFPEDNPWGDRQLARSNATMSEWMRAGIPFSSSPGTVYEYSNYGFGILGQIVERVAKKPYDDYVRDNILKPLGMKSTTYSVSEVPADRIAKGYRWSGKTWTDEPALPHGAFGAMGGLWTTPDDLARYLAFMMSAFPPRDDPEREPIRRSSAREMQQAARTIPAIASRSTIDAPLELSVSAYAYGLRIAQDCRFTYMVQHGGGLPGYGSYERWLPDYGVGLIAFGNLTYAGFVPLFDDALNAMLKTGALKHRVVQPSSALLQAKSDVSRLINQWDDALANRIAADNLFLDQPASERAEEIRKLREQHGACREEPRIDADNALRGTWFMPCDKGSLSLRITLAPTMPPRVQFLNIRSIMPPSDAMRSGIESKLSTIPAQWGKCAIGEPLSETAVKVSCQHGDLAARVAQGNVTFAPIISADQRCAP
ncbi:MAG TPA: serine hydrolase domain-containing protein [Thermoanaerobaculia bacterium]|nr:serine hydrolase domain-containing protein [Thermoanaerobaculia bacterium]